MEKYDIFISYCRVDIALASQLSKKLKELGYICFLDIDNLQIGHAYADIIQSAIAASRYVIYIYGEKSEESIEQRRELDFALENKKKVISILLKVPNKDEINPSILLNRTSCVFYTTTDEIIERIGKHIHTHSDIQLSPNRLTQSVDCNSKLNKQIRIKRTFIWGGILLCALCLCSLILFSTFRGRDCYAPPIPIPNYESAISLDSAISSIDTIFISSVDEKAEHNNGDAISPDFENSSRDTVAISSLNKQNGHNSEFTTLPKLQTLSYELMINRFICLIVGFAIGAILCLILKTRRRKNNIKLSSDVNVSISIDNIDIAEINAGEVYSTYLGKGEYLIDFKSKDNRFEQNRIIQKIEDNNPHVIFSEFLNNREIKFKCFIAGSIALSAERDALRSVMAEMYNQWDSEKIRTCSYTFEDFNRDVVTGGQQRMYDTFIEEEADWAVFIITDGIGEKTLNEYRKAMNSYIANGHPKILFLAHLDSTNDRNVEDIKNEIIQTEQYWNTCNNIEHMKSIFYKCINWDVTLLSKKKRTLT